MFCSRCGTNLSDDAKFCSVCGVATASDSPPRVAGGLGGVINVTEYAGFWRRFAAHLVDKMVLFIPSMIIFFFVGFDTLFDLADFDNADIWDIIRNFIWVGLKMAFLNQLMEWLYEAVMTSSSSQATLGKMAIGIIVTDEDGNRISFARATARYFSKILSGLILNIGYIMAGFTQKKQALHDMIAGTLVVKKENSSSRDLPSDVSTDFLQLLRSCGAFLEGHFLLSSGRHSAVYVEKFRLLEHPGITEKFAAEIANHFHSEKIDLVVGPLTGGILVAHEVAKHLNLPMAFPERTENKMEWRRGFQIKQGQKILLVEDVITTGKSVAETQSAVTREGGIIMGIGCLIQRGDTDLNPIPFPVVRLDLSSYEASECPLCKQNIPLEKRGSRK